MINFDDALNDETIESIKYIAAVSGAPVSQLLEAIEQIFNLFSESMKSIEDAFKNIEEMVDIPDDIPIIKKQIKYCKNPMEMKMLNKRLNDAYKKKNKKR